MTFSIRHGTSAQPLCSRCAFSFSGEVAVADDIVSRLRHMAWLADEGEPYADALGEAADKIERLRAAGDALVEAHGPDMCDCNQPECVSIRAAHLMWQEARRG